MGKYMITDSAKEDIEEILVYIAGDNLAAALALDSRLTKLFEMLADYNEAGRERSELENGLRSFPHDSYSIFYRRWAGDVTIVRVVHGARDLDEIFS